MTPLSLSPWHGRCRNRLARLSSLLCSDRGHTDTARSRRISLSRPEGLDRRAFLRAAGVAGAGALVGAVLPGRIAWAAALTKAERDRMTPDEIIAADEEGNERFRIGEKTTAGLPRPATSKREGTVSGGGDPELHRLARACRDDHGPRHRRRLQRARRRQHRQRRHPRQHGVRLQGRGRQGRAGDGPHRLRRDQGRHRRVPSSATSPACLRRSSPRWRPRRIRASAPRRTTPSSTRWLARMSSSRWPGSAIVVPSSPSSRPRGASRSPGRCTTSSRRRSISSPRRPHHKPAIGAAGDGQDHSPSVSRWCPDCGGNSGAASGHSMIWSARDSTDGGIVRPRVLAVLRLITISNFVGCSTGRSPGLAPLRILST